MTTLIHCLAVGGAGFVGALARFGLTSLFARALPTRFPLATLVINVTGSFALGWFLTYLRQRGIASDALRLAVATGFLGAYTTFSTFAYDTVHLAHDGATAHAAANVALSVVLGLLAAWLGTAVGRWA